jgi:hypothetical protein
MREAAAVIAAAALLSAPVPAALDAVASSPPPASSAAAPEGASPRPAPEGASPRPAPEADASALLRAADRPRGVIDEGVIRIRATVEEAETPAVVSALDVYVQGADRALCVFTGGPLAGRKVLTVADRAWLLIPGASKPIPVSGGQRLLGGASIADVARLRFADTFTATERGGEEEALGAACRVLDLRAKSPKAPYASGMLWVGVSDGLARRARFALRSGKDAKEVTYTGYGRERGQPILKKMEIAHLLRSERGLRTTIEFLAYEGRAVDAALFTPDGARVLQASPAP